MRICVIGTGYVGLTTAACMAELGHQVNAIDIDEDKVSRLSHGEIPIYEPNLDELIYKNLDQCRLSFDTNIHRGIQEAEIIFISVGTPPLSDGSANLSQVEDVARTIGRFMDGYKIVVIKSTVPVGTNRKVQELISQSQTIPIDFALVSNPEFLREGSAVRDMFHADRVVIGARSARALEVMTHVYQPLQSPIVTTSPETAEMIKYASNAFLATKISFINEIANVCEHFGADVRDVALGMGMDHRINKHFLDAGVGYGGSCFSKDIQALLKIGQSVDIELRILQAVEAVNRNQRLQLVCKLGHLIGSWKNKTIAVLGLSFKAGTDDLRDAPSVDIIRLLQHKGATVKAYDPVAVHNAKPLLPNVLFYTNVYDALYQTDAAVVLTEWPEIQSVEWKSAKSVMKSGIVIDGRNLFDPIQMHETGCQYVAIGRVMA